MSCEVRFDKDAACDRCGHFGAFIFDGQKLCGNCYETRGSCCPECGSDDLWDDETPPTADATSASQKQD